MDPSIVVAVITGIAAISAAVIQAISAVRVAKIKELGAQAEPARTTPRSQPMPETHSQAWWQIIGILIGANILSILLLEWDAPIVIHLGAIPWCTCLLAYFRPLRWGYVAGIVTVVSLIAVFSFFVLGGNYTGGDVPTLALAFVANSVLAAGIAYFRQRQLSCSVISDIAIRPRPQRPNELPPLPADTTCTRPKGVHYAQASSGKAA